MRQIVLDTETTGLDPLTGDRVIEVAAVELFNLLPTGEAFHSVIDPERDIPAEASRIHGFTMVMSPASRNSPRLPIS
jgi:DNA polymerase III subunit epsilon